MAQEIYFTHDIMKPKDVKNNSRKRDYQEANLEQLDILNLVKGKCTVYLEKQSGHHRTSASQLFLSSDATTISKNWHVRHLSGRPGRGIYIVYKSNTAEFIFLQHMKAKSAVWTSLILCKITCQRSLMNTPQHSPKFLI